MLTIIINLVLYCLSLFFSSEKYDYCDQCRSYNLILDIFRSFVCWTNFVRLKVSHFITFIFVSTHVCTHGWEWCAVCLKIISTFWILLDSTMEHKKCKNFHTKSNSLLNTLINKQFLFFRSLMHNNRRFWIF